MPENDSTIQALPSMSAPLPDDLMLIVDTSDAFEAKKISIEALTNYLFSSSPAFNIQNQKITLKQPLDAASNKIINLTAGDNDNDAVNYATVAPMIKSLDSITPALPTITDNGSTVKASTIPIADPPGGFYLFYWCVDSSIDTQISVSGQNVTSSSNAPVHFDGSVANVCSIPKIADMNGKYLHIAIRYRNFSSLSKLSNTATLLIPNTTTIQDLISVNVAAPSNLTISKFENKIFLKATPPEASQPGTSYIAEIVFNDLSSYTITGNETPLIRIMASSPIFTYDLPLLQAQFSHCHARVGTLSFNSNIAFTTTASSDTSYDPTYIQESFLSLIADRMSERLQVEGGQNLIVKTPK